VGVTGDDELLPPPQLVMKRARLMNPTEAARMGFIFDHDSPGVVGPSAKVAGSLVFGVDYRPDSGNCPGRSIFGEGRFPYFTVSETW
jgi:hypothetical protein